jgi:hypothetical protein
MQEYSGDIRRDGQKNADAWYKQRMEDDFKFLRCGEHSRGSRGNPNLHLVQITLSKGEFLKTHSIVDTSEDLDRCRCELIVYQTDRRTEGLRLMRAVEYSHPRSG